MCVCLSCKIVSRYIRFLVIGNVMKDCNLNYRLNKTKIRFNTALRNEVISDCIRMGSGRLAPGMCSPESFLSRARLPKPERKTWFGCCKGKVGENGLLTSTFLAPLNPLLMMGRKKTRSWLGWKINRASTMKRSLKICVLFKY